MNQLENFGIKKEMTPEQYAILIEKDVIEKYSPLLNKYLNQNLTPEQAKMEWIKKYAVDYRAFFNQHKNELIEQYKREPGKVIDYIEHEIEGNA